jgi:3-hydroxyisobutyrate dehydrogenase-like beta-hydroxyacid dehydrogenase
MTHLAFIGIGRMGGPMATRLLAAGHAVTVFDPDASAVERLTSAGASALTAVGSIAPNIEIYFTSLPTPEIVESVAMRLPAAKPGTQPVFVDMSTTGARAAARIASILGQKGIAMVDAPISGGIKGAVKGTLAISASGPRAQFDRVAPLLEKLGRAFYVGAQPGQGQTVKLINNLLSAAAMAISSEAVVMAEKAGLDVAQVLDIINSGSGRNSATADKILHHVIPRTFDYGFTIGLVDKDVRLCMEEAEALGVPMVVGSAVRQLLSVCRHTEGASADITHLVKTVEGWAGTRVAAGHEKRG